MSKKSEGWKVTFASGLNSVAVAGHFYNESGGRIIPNSSSSFLGRGGTSTKQLMTVTSSPNCTGAGVAPMGSSHGYF